MLYWQKLGNNASTVKRDILVTGKYSELVALWQIACMIGKLRSRAFQRYMTCLSRQCIGKSYNVGKLLTSAFK